MAQLELDLKVTELSYWAEHKKVNEGFLLQINAHTPAQTGDAILVPLK